VMGALGKLALHPARRNGDRVEVDGC
jgi:hypothetical protein